MNAKELRQTTEDSFKRDPILFTGAFAALLIGVSKVLEATNNRKNAKSWARETKRRDRQANK